MSRPGVGPSLLRSAARLASAVAVAAGAGLLGAGLSSGTHVAASGRRAHTSSPVTTTTSPWVPGTGGTMTVGIDKAPTGCNPNTASGDTWADRLLLEPVLPSAFTVTPSDQAVYNSALITQAELQGTNPQTVVYTINPKAVWSDGTPVTAADFVYTWEQERGTVGPLGAATTPTAATTATTATTTTTTTATTATTTTTTTSAGSTSAPSGVATPEGATPALSTPSATSPATSPPRSTKSTPAPTFTTPTFTTPPATTTLPGATGTTGPAVGYRQVASVTSGPKGLTVTVVFKKPYADWQSLFNYLLPAHVLMKTGWNPPCTTLDPAIDLSAGPYMLRSVVPGKEVVLVRNPRWWGRPPALEQIVVRIASGPAQLSQWLADGTVDVALPSGYDEHFLQAVTSQPSVASQTQLSTTFLQLEFSTTSPTTSSTDLRLAIAHAIDRQTLVNDVVGWASSAITPAESLLYAQTQPGYPSHPPPLQVSGQPGSTTTTTSSGSTASTPFPANADLAATTRLLTAAGLVRVGSGSWKLLTGKPFALRMAVDVADAWASPAAANIVRQLGAAGIRVSITDASSAQAAGLDLARGEAAMALLPMHSSPYPSQAIAWYTPLLGTPGTGGSQDWSNLDDPTVNALLEKASEQLNPVDAGPIYSEVDTALWQQMVALPLFTEPSLLAWSELTAGVSPNPDGPSLLWDAQSWALRVPPTSQTPQP